MLDRYFAIGSAVALVVMWFAWDRDMAQLRASHADAISDLKGEYDAYKLQVEQTATDSALNFAKATQELLGIFKDQQAEADRLRIARDAAQLKADKLSAENLRILANAPQTDVSPLDVGSREFFARLRAQQQARGSGDPPAGR